MRKKEHTKNSKLEIKTKKLLTVTKISNPMDRFKSTLDTAKEKN